MVVDCSWGIRSVANLLCAGNGSPLILFTGLFVVCAMVALVLYLVDRASRWGLGVAGQQAKRAMVAAEEISKKQLRRPRSEPAQ